MALQFSFDDAPVLDTPTDVAAIMRDAGPVITDARVGQRLHRRGYPKMDPNKRSDGKVVTYRITVENPGETEQAPARQEVIDPEPMANATLDRVNLRARWAKEINGATLDGREIVQVKV